MLFYVDGEFVPQEDAVVPILDYGFLYGDGCYESIAVTEGTAIDLDWRIERLFRSARMLRIEVPIPPEQLRELLLETAVRNGMREGDGGYYLRPFLTRGVGQIGGMTNANRIGTLRVLAMAVPAEKIGYRGPVKVANSVFTSYVRTVPLMLDPRIKYTNYSSSMLAKFEAKERGADWPIFRDADGFITEVGNGNIFAVTDGRVLTPLVKGALGGLVRRRVIAVARELGTECLETEMTRYDLECADEVFVTAALSCVTAIGNIEGLDVPAPGPVTTALRDAYVASALADGTPVPALVGAAD